MADRSRESYRGVSLIARTYRNGVHGKAWCHGREIAALEGVSEPDVLASLKSLIDEEIIVELEAGSVPYPDMAKYQVALEAVLKGITAKQQLMLSAHYKARSKTLSGQQLAEAAKFPSWTAAKQQYGILGRALGEAMLFQPREGNRGVPMWILVLADSKEQSGPEPSHRWCMREGLVAALDAIKFA